jgi:hypothetical protein
VITLNDKQQISGIQNLLGVTADGVWGPKSQAALAALVAPKPVPGQEIEHKTYASSFADPADVAAFNKCKAQGKSDQECFKVGDNGIGCWGQSTVEGTGPSCALPPEYMTARWGSKSAAKNKEVLVQLDATGKKVLCVLKDQMPSVENLANDAKIDLNPDACAALDLEPPIMEKVTWWWMEPPRHTLD